MEPNTRKVGVLGTGTMGAGIVQVTSQAGYWVVACDHAVEALERAQLYVRDGLSRVASKGVISEEEAAAAYDRIHWNVDADGTSEAVASLVDEGMDVTKSRAEVENAVERTVASPAVDGTCRTLEDRLVRVVFWRNGLRNTVFTQGNHREVTHGA